MRIFSAFIFLLLLTNHIALSQEKQSSPYELNPAVDIPITVAGTGLSLYGFYLISQKEGISKETVMSLSPSDVNAFDRAGTRQFSVSADNNSDYFLYGALPVPIIVGLIDKDIRSDFWKVGFMFLEAMAIDGTAYTMTAGNVSRYRPLVYNTDAPLHERMRGNSRNAFMGGHPSVTATAGFFIAKVYADYHPDSNLKYAIYGLAAIATSGNALLRYKAGKHFPTDLLTGVTVGTLTGILVPELHKKNRKNNLTLIPFSGRTSGLYMCYKF